jgi:hypothetical protein
MTIVAVHGVWNYRRGLAPTTAAQELAAAWRTALPGDPPVVGAYYAHRLRHPGKQSAEETLDELEPFARQLIAEWLAESEAGTGMPQGRLTRNLRQDLARYALKLPPQRLLFETVITRIFGEVARYLDPDSPARILARTEVANAIAAANQTGRRLSWHIRSAR